MKKYFLIFFLGSFRAVAGNDPATANIYHIWMRITNVGTTPWPPAGCANHYYTAAAAQTCGCCGGGGSVGPVKADITAVIPGGTVAPGGSADFFSPSFEVVAYGCSGSSGALTVSICGQTVYSGVFGYDPGDYVDAVFPSTEPLQIYVNGCDATMNEPCQTNLTWNLKNNALFGSECLAVIKSGAIVYGPTAVPAGTTYNLNLTVECSEASQYSLQPVQCAEGGLAGSANSPAIGGAIPPSSSGPGSGNNGATGTFSGIPPGYQLTTNLEGNLFLTPITSDLGVPQNNILWSPVANGATTPNSQAVASSIQNGDSVLHNDLSSAATQAHADAQAIENAISAQNPGTGSNVFNLSLTNYATESTLQGISNILGGSYAGTNLGDGGFGSNLVTVSSNWYAPTTNEVTLGGETNYADASNASGGASTELQQVETDLATFISEMTPVSIDDSAFDPGDMTYTFPGFNGSPANLSHKADLGNSGYTIDFNPMNDDRFAQLFGFSRTLWTWGLALTYLMRCAKDAVKAIEMCENARGVVVTSPTTKKTYS